MPVKGKIHSVTLLLLSMLALSCGRADNTGKDAKTGVTPETAGSVTPPSGSLSLKPEVPRAGTTLHALYSGTANNIAYRWEVNGKAIEGEKDERLSLRGLKKGDDVRVTVIADGTEVSSRAIVGNTPPSVSEVRLYPEHIRQGVDIKAVPAGYDPDDDEVSFIYRWYINGREASGATGPVLAGTGFRKGDEITLRVTPWDGVEEGPALTSSPVRIKNAPPGFESLPPKEFLSQSYTYEAKASDPDGDAISYSLAKAPEGMRISKEGKITWDIKDYVQGDFEISVIADDGQGGTASQDFTISVRRSGE